MKAGRRAARSGERRKGGEMGRVEGLSKGGRRGSEHDGTFAVCGARVVRGLFRAERNVRWKERPEGPSRMEWE